MGNIHIKNLQIGTWKSTVTLENRDNFQYVLRLQNNDLTVHANLTVEKNRLAVDLTNCSSKLYNTTVTGKAYLDLQNVGATGHFSTVIDNSFAVNIAVVADEEKLSFEGTEGRAIHSISPLVDLFDLQDSTQRWITEYLSGSRYHLKSFKGTLPWHAPNEIVKTLAAEVRVDNTEYTFAPGLEPIKARYTDVHFTNGVLLIKPHDATFYDQNCGESWLDINFNDSKNILLTAYIKTHAVGNDDILNLLNYYHIALPFKQLGGTTDTNLRLSINLNTHLVETKGHFIIDKGIIEWGGKNYTVRDTSIKQVNSDITIDSLKVRYSDFCTAQISGFIEAKKKTGDLNINFLELDLKRGEHRLNADAANSLQLKYHFDPKEQYFDALPSSWLVDSLRFKLGAFRAPVTLADLALEIPPVQLESDERVVSEISGYLSFKKNRANFTCNLLKYHIKDVQLMSPHMALNLVYNGSILIKTAETTQWELNKTPLHLSPSLLKYEDDIFTIEQSRICYGTYFDSYLAGYYNRKDRKGHFSINKIDASGKGLEDQLKFDRDIDIEGSGSGENFMISLPSFDIKIHKDKGKNWSVNVGDLSKVYSHSKILQQYNIKEGSLTISAGNHKNTYEFTADIKAPYPLLVEGDTPVTDLHMSGQVADGAVYATLNRDIDLEYANESLKISSKNLGYNITAIKQLLNDLFPSSLHTDSEKGDDTNRKKTYTIQLTARNSQIYISPKSRVLADIINLEYHNGKLLGNLDHGSGKVIMHMEDGTFTVEGNDLNDEFMGALIPNSKFHGGKMSLAAAGRSESATAIINIKETVLNKLVIINNLMAFLDTVPALATFSLPEYSSKGLRINSALVGLEFKNNVMNFESIEVISPEVHAKGKGKIDLAKKQIEMDIQLKTQASKNLGKLPVAGYILAGKDDDESITVKLTGNLDAPEVDYSLLKEIVTYPVEILRRSFKLPFNFAEKIGQQFEKTGASETTQ